MKRFPFIGFLVGLGVLVSWGVQAAEEESEVEPELAIERFQAGEWEADAGYCQASRVGRLIYVSATSAPGVTLEIQMKTIYLRIQATLGQFGATMDTVVNERIAVLDLEKFLAANESVRVPFYKAGTYPTRSWTQVQRLADPSALIEIEVVAIAASD